MHRTAHGWLFVNNGPGQSQSWK